jgi:hypothetical protein
MSNLRGYSIGLAVLLGLVAAPAARGAEFVGELKDVPADVTAKFELWLPANIGSNEMVRGLILASDYQAGTEIYQDAGYRALAEKLRFGMLRHKLFRQRKGRRGPCWDAECAAILLRGLAELAKQSGHREVAHACFIHTGLSWSGMQSPGLAAALPERTIGAVAYHTSDFSEFPAAFGVPLLLLIAEYDQYLAPLRVHEELLKCRAAGARWAGCYQAGEEHHNLGDPELMLAWIEDVVKLRLPAELPADRPAKLNALSESSGWLGVLPMDAKTFRRDAGALPARTVAFADFTGDRARADWLPTERVARLWSKWTSTPDLSPHGARPFGAVGSPDKPAPVRRTLQPLPAPYSRKAAGSLQLRWDETGLHGALSAVDADVKSDAATPWKANCLELFFEKDFARAPQRSTNAVQWAIAPGAADGPAIVWPEAIKTEVRATWKRTATGYTLEFFIPARLLAPAALKPGTTLGFNYCLTDHDGKPVEEFFCSKQAGGFAIPALWGAITLVDQGRP